MWAVVEQVIDNKLYIQYDDGTRKVFINDQNIVIKENNYINIENNKIIEVKAYNEQLYKKIKELENKIFKNNKN